MARHLIIAGHGETHKGSGFDPGATGYIPKGEHKFMEENLFPAMKKYTKDSKDTFIFHTAYKVLDKGNLKALADQHNADTVTEYHYDSLVGSSASGGHVIIHEDFQPDELDLRIRDVIEKMVGIRYSHKGHKGISGRPSNEIGMVRMAKNGGVNFRLPELGFGSNKRDADIMMNKVDEYARRLVEAYDGTPRVPKENVNPKPDSKPKDDTKPQDYTGNSVVDFLNLPANKDLGGSKIENRKKLAESYGIKNYTGTSSQNITLLNKLQSNTKPSKQTREQVAQDIATGKGGWGNNPGRAEKLTESGFDAKWVQSRVNDILKGKTTTSAPKVSKPASKGLKVGDKVTTTSLYVNAMSTQNVRKTPISGYIHSINKKAKNPIRLTTKPNGGWLGFTREKDIK